MKGEWRQRASEDNKRKADMNWFRWFLLYLLIQLLTALWYWEQYSLPWDRFGVLVLDSVGKSLTAVLAMMLLEKIWNTRHTSALFPAYTVLLYNQNSILKFSVDQLFDGFIRDSIERLLGGFLVDGAILLGIGVLFQSVRLGEKRSAVRKRADHQAEKRSTTWDEHVPEKEIMSGKGQNQTEKMDETKETQRIHLSRPAGRERAIRGRTVLGTVAYVDTENPAKRIIPGLVAAGMYAVISLSSLVLNGKPVIQITSRPIRTVWEALTDLVYLSCVLSWEIGSKRRKKSRQEFEREIPEKTQGEVLTDLGRNHERIPPEKRSGLSCLQTWRGISMLPFAVVGAVQGITTLYTGSKQALAGFVLYSLLALLVTGKIAVRGLKGFLVISPLVLCLLTGVSEKTSGRLSRYPDRFVMQYHAFRYDLSDFAVTVAERRRVQSKIHNDLNGQADLIPIDREASWKVSGISKKTLLQGFEVLLEALRMSVPKGLPSGKVKPERLIAYEEQFSGLGLCSNEDDYNDTLFSMGAQLLGYPGILLILPTILLWIDEMGYVVEIALRRALRDPTREEGEEKEERRARGRAERQMAKELHIHPEKENIGLCSKISAVIALLIGLPYYMQAEGDWFMWIYRTRDFMFEMTCILVLFSFGRFFGMRGKR